MPFQGRVPPEAFDIIGAFRVGACKATGEVGIAMLSRFVACFRSRIAVTNPAEYLGVFLKHFQPFIDLVSALCRKTSVMVKSDDDLEGSAYHWVSLWKFQHCQ